MRSDGKCCDVTVTGACVYRRTRQNEIVLLSHFVFGVAVGGFIFVFFIWLVDATSAPTAMAQYPASTASSAESGGAYPCSELSQKLRIVDDGWSSELSATYGATTFKRDEAISFIEGWDDLQLLKLKRGCV